MADAAPFLLAGLLMAWIGASALRQGVRYPEGGFNILGLLATLAALGAAGAGGWFAHG